MTILQRRTYNAGEERIVPPNSGRKRQSVKNYYETLQISPSASHLVVGKVYRVLAGLYHPDNQETGNAERFREVCEAYEVLSDSSRRKEYEAQLPGEHSSEAASPVPETVGDFTRPTNDREIRNLMLQLLYENRKADPYKPALGIVVIAEVLGVDTDELEFPRWYLLEKGHITMSSSANCSITAAGVDYVESKILRVHDDEPSSKPALVE